MVPQARASRSSESWRQVVSAVRLGYPASRDGGNGGGRNVGRVEALRAEGRMRPAGEAAYGRRRDDRTAIYSFEQQLAFDDAANAALDGADGARAFWDVQPPGYRRSATHWVMSAKRTATREKRLGMLVEASARGERVAAIAPPTRPAKPAPG